MFKQKFLYTYREQSSNIQTALFLIMYNQQVLTEPLS